MDTVLAPLTVGGCLSDAFNHLSKRWRAWVGSALVYFGGVFGVVFMLVMPLVFVGVFGLAFVSAASGGNPDSAVMLLLLAPVVLMGVVFWLGMMFIAAIVPLGMARLSLRALRCESTTYWEIFHYARTPGPAIGLFFLNLLITFPLLCLGILPGLIYGVAALFAPLLMVDRELGPLEAIQGSIELFRSSWGPMLLLWVAIIGLTIIFSNVPVIGAFAMMLVQSAAIGIAYLQLTGQTIGGLDDDGLPRRAPA
ncbi:MAG: hypothetical protein IPI35_19390 [Deltaproteobacteria bacterium]|nr:hypothetical protein [Deltaproteobacteria bacterium]